MWCVSGRCASSRQFITSQFQVHRWVPAASWSAKPFSSAASMALSFASRGRWRDIAGGRGCFSCVQAVLCSFLLASDAPLPTAPSPGRKSGARGSSASSQSRPSLVTSCHRPPDVDTERSGFALPGQPYRQSRCTLGGVSCPALVWATQGVPWPSSGLYGHFPSESSLGTGAFGFVLCWVFFLAPRPLFKSSLYIL